jgi:hypothetical protein
MASDVVAWLAASATRAIQTPWPTSGLWLVEGWSLKLGGPCHPVVPCKHESGFESVAQSHRQGQMSDSERLIPVRPLAFFTLFGFVLAFSGRFIDSI